MTGKSTDSLVEAKEYLMSVRLISSEEEQTFLGRLSLIIFRTLADKHLEKCQYTLEVKNVNVLKENIAAHQKILSIWDVRKLGGSSKSRSSSAEKQLVKNKIRKSAFTWMRPVFRSALKEF